MIKEFVLYKASGNILFEFVPYSGKLNSVTLMTFFQVEIKLLG